MLSLKIVNDAVRYNKNLDKRVWGVTELPFPWSVAISNHREFVWITALFQSENRLKVDGKLGPNTWKRIKRDSDATPIEVPAAPVVNGKSDCVISGGKKHILPDKLLALGVRATNYIDDDEPHFKHRLRRKKLMYLTLHETVGNTAKGCKNTLLKRGYGVHLILDPKGNISCHGDLMLDRTVHANHLNNTSIGIEVVNPYSPLYARKPFAKSISRKWWTWVPSMKSEDVRKLVGKKGWDSVPKEYVLPTDKQMQTIKLLVPWLCEITGIPYKFPTKGLGPKKRKMKWPGAGVVSHSCFAGHADGRYILEEIAK